MTFQKPKCNCPDATNQRQRDPGANALSNQISSDWSKDFNGIRNADGYCKHEVAVLRIRKELSSAFPNGLATDLPTPEPPSFPKDKTVYKLQKNPLLGDDFSI